VGAAVVIADDAIERLRILRMEVAAGRPPNDLGGLAGDTRSALAGDAAAAVATAEAVGAPLLPVLDGVANGLRAERDITHAVGAAAAPARLVAVALTLLPVVAVPMLARLTGADLLAFYATPTGLVVAAVGGCLWLAGVAMTVMIARHTGRRGADPGRPSRAPALLAGLVAAALVGPLVGILVGLGVALLRRPAGVPVDPSLATVCEVVAAAMSAGVGPAAAVRHAAKRLPGPRADLLRLAMHLDVDREPSVPSLQPLAAVLRTTARLGSPAVPALHELAAQLRADRLAAALADAQRLPTRLTFPAALCLLPATLLLVGAPIVAEGLGAVMGT
jgi:Flp pilus assembly protein TadB